MHKYLPSKKFALIFLSIIIALGIIFGFSFLMKPKTVTVIQEKAETNTKIEEFMILDSDNDGLKDWEEALWKTDPKIADTDGDGTSDGEEAKLNRNPLVANTAKAGATPSDQADIELIEANKKKDEEFAKLSETDKIAHTLFSQYLASKSASGAPVSDINKQIILDTAIANTENSNVKKYFTSDLKIGTSLSSTTIKDYGNNLAQAFFTAGTGVEKVSTEMEILDRAVQTQDQQVLTGLDPIIEGYSNTIAKILLISVPSDAINIHLALLNNLSLLKTSLEEMKSLFSDPALAIAGIDKYQTSVVNIRKNILSLKNYFLQKGIVFTPTEGEYGYIFLNNI